MEDSNGKKVLKAKLAGEKQTWYETYNSLIDIKIFFIIVM